MHQTDIRSQSNFGDHGLGRQFWHSSTRVQVCLLCLCERLADPVIAGTIWKVTFSCSIMFHQSYSPTVRIFRSADFPAAVIQLFSAYSYLIPGCLSPRLMAAHCYCCWPLADVLQGC